MDHEFSTVQFSALCEGLASMFVSGDTPQLREVVTAYDSNGSTRPIYLTPVVRQADPVKTEAKALELALVGF